LFTCLAAIACLMVQGCYTPLVEGAQQAWDAGRRGGLAAGGAAGDPVAQFELGDSWCCRGGGPMDHATIYDNHKATYWYCKAARQGYGPAQLRLARMYGGHPIHGLHLVLRASAVIGDAPVDLGLAMMWAGLAAARGVEGASIYRDDLAARADASQRSRAQSLVADWRGAPCAWAEVFPASRGPR
jgi:TPR repeat protein